MTEATQLQAWGECLVKDCHIVGIRCYWGSCEAHCQEKHLGSDGVYLHAVRPKDEVYRVTPWYKPTKPKLVAVTKLKEDAA